MPIEIGWVRYPNEILSIYHPLVGVRISPASLLLTNLLVAL